MYGRIIENKNEQTTPAQGDKLKRSVLVSRELCSHILCQKHISQIPEEFILHFDKKSYISHGEAMLHNSQAAFMQAGLHFVNSGEIYLIATPEWR